MTYRIAVSTDDADVTLAVQGVLDRVAITDLRSRCEAQIRRGCRPRVFVEAGTTVETGAIDDLVRIEGISIVAESPFLARWIGSLAGNAEEDAR